MLDRVQLDVTKLRYRDWDDSRSHRAYSAMPVGRFVLDVHGESEEECGRLPMRCARLCKSSIIWRIVGRLPEFLNIVPIFAYVWLLEAEMLS